MDSSATRCFSDFAEHTVRLPPGLAAGVRSRLARGSPLLPAMASSPHLWHQSEAREAFRDPSSCESFCLFRLIRLGYGDGDWCRGMENAVGYFMCWAIFILSTLLTLVLSVVFAVLKLLVIWPSILLVCLMLGMNLRLFLLFPSFLTWVGKWLLGLDEHQAKVAKCIHDEPGTNRRRVGRGDPTAIPAIAITLINEILKKAREQSSGTLSPEGWFAIMTSVLALTRFLWPPWRGRR